MTCLLLASLELMHQLTDSFPLKPSLKPQKHQYRSVGDPLATPLSDSIDRHSTMILFMAPADDDTYDDEEPPSPPSSSAASNVLGTTLECCCADVGESGIGTGFYRNGYCSTGEQDLGRHTVCCQVTDEFLEFSKAVGNDLSTPMPQYMFPGLKDGNLWCLCASRWAQAYEQGKAPKIYLKATHEKTLDYAPFEVLREYALDGSEADERLDELNEQREKLNKLL